MRSTLLICALLAAACGSASTGNDNDGGTGGGDGGVCGPGSTAEGCACTPGAAPVTCFDGTAAQAATLPCMKGTRSCDAVTSRWGKCDGEVAPALEMCDGIDNDCNGQIDDGVLSACGDCTPGCETTGSGMGTPFPFPGDPLPPNVTGIDVNGVGLNPDGDLILNADNIDFHFLWVANSGEGTVSKIDTVTGKEVARYASVTHAAVVDVMGVGATFPAWGGANAPSRTAVDYYGDVWVANRAFGYQPSATKILNTLADCTDRNGDGIIETSSDVDGDGRISLMTPEFYGEDDECIAMTVVVGANDGWNRAAAIDGGGVDPGDPGNVWIGNFNEGAFYQLNGKTGALIKRVPATGSLGINPYGAAIDSMGHLWAPNSCCGASSLTEIDTTTGAVMGTWPQTGLGCYGSYGIAVDNMDKIWVAGWPCASAIRFDPVTTTFTEVPVPGYYGAAWGSRGIGPDALGNMWMSLHTHVFDTNGAVARINGTTLAVDSWDLNANDGVAANNAGVPVGAAVDFDGNVWTVDQNTSNAAKLYIDPVTHSPAPNPVTGNMVDEYPVGNAPYTYSDFTGLGLRTIVRPQGDYVVTMEGCPDGSQATWNQVNYNATAPAGTSVEIWVRVGDDLATIGSQPQYGPWLAPPANLQVPPGPVPMAKYMQLTIRLISADRASTPVVHDYDVQWQCPGVPLGAAGPESHEYEAVFGI